MEAKKTYSLVSLCPICEHSPLELFVQSAVADCKICIDCDYLIDLGFSNYDEQPELCFYPSSWVYNRLYALTGRNYLQAKRLWLDEVVEFFRVTIAAGPDARKDFQRRRGITLEQALLETKQDIDRVEQLLTEKP